MPNGKEEKEEKKEGKEEKKEKKKEEKIKSFNDLPVEIKKYIFQFFDPDKHKMTNINLVSTEWNKYSKSDFMALKYCKRTPKSGWGKKLMVDPVTGRPSNAGNAIDYKPDNPISKMSKRDIEKHSTDKITYEFKYPDAKLKAIEITHKNGTYGIKFIGPKYSAVMKDIINYAAVKSFMDDVGYDLLSRELQVKTTTNIRDRVGNRLTSRELINLLTFLKKEEKNFERHHGIPKIVLDALINDIEQRKALFKKPSTSPGK